MKAFAVRTLILLSAASSFLATGANAQGIPADPDPTRLANAPNSGDDWQVQIGLGALYSPAFLGSDDYQLQAGPNIEVRYQDRFFISMIDGIGFDLIKTDNFRAGPIVNYGQGRNEDGSSSFRIAGARTDALLGLGDISGAAEVGGYLAYQSGGFSAKVEVRQAIGSHDGLIAQLGARYTTGLTGLTVGDRTPIFSIGPRVTIVDDNYNQAFFGIDAGQSARSGLAEYDAGGGLQSYGVGTALILPVSKNLSAALLGGYDRLAGDAADSPLVLERGSRNQATVGLGLTYRFGM